MTLSRRQLIVQVLLFFIVVAAGISSAMLLTQGSLTFTAMPLLMALLALGLAFAGMVRR
jgi:hypothetical protein